LNNFVAETALIAKVAVNATCLPGHLWWLQLPDPCPYFPMYGHNLRPGLYLLGRMVTGI